MLGLVANTRFPTVRVLETTDFHGALLPGAKERRSGRAYGGSAVLAAHLRRLRAENPEGTILLDGGDAFQGTMISNLQYGRPVVSLMDHLGVPPRRSRSPSRWGCCTRRTPSALKRVSWRKSEPSVAREYSSTGERR